MTALSPPIDLRKLQGMQVYPASVDTYTPSFSSPKLSKRRSKIVVCCHTVLWRYSTYAKWFRNVFRAGTISQCFTRAMHSLNIVTKQRQKMYFFHTAAFRLDTTVHFYNLSLKFKHILPQARMFNSADLEWVTLSGPRPEVKFRWNLFLQ